jgi:hypothetical protein
MDEMVKLIPSEHIELDKDLVSVTERDEDGTIHLSFKDGSTATADVGKQYSFMCK